MVKQKPQKIDGKEKVEIQIPEGVEIKLEDSMIKVKGKLGEITRNFDFRKIDHKIEGDKLTLVNGEKRRKERAYFGTVCSHIQNMIQGVTKGWHYKLKIVYAHFPINVSVSNDRVMIKNFAGEKKERYSKIVGDAKIEIKGQEIDVTGINREHVGQTCANLEQATKIRKMDPRVFSDGIYITSKGDDHHE